ncbi:hypothetical protein NG99_24345 [Erwinia typographi]|uniref:HTH luxR-type domain-containing protein n=2 Tax=Erwinia typographi TaxID=371042 RepID=A0A0A3YJS7_9GAMM|nr:hypothetical protein NG99_24345 [Erwinia typographi]
MHFFNKSQEPWGVKDIHSHFIYVNQAYIDYLEIKQDIANLSYEAVTAFGSFKKGLVAHDQKVMQTGLRLEAVGTLLVGDNYRSFIFEKYPFFDRSGSIIGTVVHLKPFEHISMGFFLEKPFYGEATFTPPTDIFSNREWDVLFLLFRGLERKQIAEKLGISENTVRNNISRIFLIAGTNSRESLLDKGMKNGWHLYVPPLFVSVGYNMLFKEGR